MSGAIGMTLKSQNLEARGNMSEAKAGLRSKVSLGYFRLV
jgi:hypothetical protein